jgi:hypothetical protein
MVQGLKKKKPKPKPWEKESYDFTEEKPPLLEADTSTPEPPSQSDAQETIRRLKRRNEELEDLYGEGKAGEQAKGLSPEEKKKKKKKKP